MKIDFFIVFISFLLILFGCNSQVKDSSFLRKWHYENGQVKRVQEYSADSVKNGLYLFYNESGYVIDSALIRDGKLHGKRFLYFDNGIIKNVTMYKNGIYRSGIDYDSLGMLEYYGGYNYSQDLMFLIEFDSLGRINSFEGNPIYSWVMEEYYAVGDTLSIELLVPNIPDYKTEVSVIDSKTGEEETHMPDEFNRVVYRKLRADTIARVISHYLVIRDRENKAIITDTLVFNLSSKGEMTYQY